MTLKQIHRAYRKLYANVTRGSGYQPFGWDWPTMNICHPGFRPAVDRLQEMLAAANRE